MFSINIYLKFALIGICLIGGVLLAIFTSFWYALPIILIGLILLASYILLGTIQSAAQIMETGDMAATDARLNLTWKPEWLFGPNKAMYYMLKGTMAIQNKKVDEGEEWFKKAEGIKMPSDNEAAMIQLQLAGLNASKRKWNQANVYMKNAKKLNVTNPQISAQMLQLEQMIKTKGMSQARMIKQKGKRGQRFHN